MTPGSDDIVARLRSTCRGMEAQGELLARAADEINRLRAELIRRGEEVQRYRDRDAIADGRSMNDTPKVVDIRPGAAMAEDRMTVFKPCPFCGGQYVSTCRGSSFNHVVACCNGCGAQAREVRKRTVGDGTTREWQARADADAIIAWNERAPTA